MNLKITKQKRSQAETPIKKSQSFIVLSQFFSRPTQQTMNKKHSNSLNRQLAQKQNIDPNLQGHRQMFNGKDRNSVKKSPKRKIIHLKSISKNSKSNKQGNSGSFGKKYSVEHTYTQVADFDNQNSIPPPTIKINVNLKNHRRSMQDTMVSSNSQNQPNIQSQNIVYCDQHANKKATFVVKGRPYCDKCSVKLITKGFVAVRIKNQRNYQNQQPYQYLYYENQEKQKKKRELDLKHFIQELDRIQPIIESMGLNLQSYLQWRMQQNQFQVNKFQQYWGKMLQFLQNYKQHLLTNLKAQEKKTLNFLQQTRVKIKQQTKNLNFMRNDIVRNIDRIIDETAVPYQKYTSVMDSFRQQLQDIHANTFNIQNSSFELPKIQFNIYEFDKQIRNSFYITSLTEQLFLNKKLYEKNIIQDQADSYRLSFGKQIDKVQSPTFKVI